MKKKELKRLAKSSEKRANNWFREFRKMDILSDTLLKKYYKAEKDIMYWQVKYRALKMKHGKKVTK